MLTLLSLPFEILSEVLKHLPARDILRLQRVDKFFHRRLFIDIDVWLILNKFLLHDCGIQYNVERLFREQDEQSIQAIRRLILSPCRLWKHIQRVPCAEYRNTLRFPQGYRLECMALLTGGRWLMVGSSERTLDIWDTHPSTVLRKPASPTVRLPHRWLVQSISLYPESPNGFLAAVEYTEEEFDQIGHDGEDGSSSHPSDSGKSHCAVVRVVVPSVRGELPSMTVVSQARHFGAGVRFCGDVIVSDDTARGGCRQAWNWKTGKLTRLRYAWDETCRKSNAGDLAHEHHICPHSLLRANRKITTLCYPNKTQHTFDLPDFLFNSSTLDADHQQKSHTDVNAQLSQPWGPEDCRSEGGLRIHQHSVIFEYATLGRPPTSRYPEFFVDICSAYGLSIGYVDRARADGGPSAPSVLVNPVRFYTIALEGAIRVYPHEGKVLVLVLMASNRSLSDYDDEDNESFKDFNVDDINYGTLSAAGSSASSGLESNNHGIKGETTADTGMEDERASTSTASSTSQPATDLATIFGFLIPIDGIRAGHFTKGSDYDYIVRSFALKERLSTDEEVAVMRECQDGYLDRIAYDFISGRIVVTGKASQGVVILDFDELQVTGNI